MGQGQGQGTGDDGLAELLFRHYQRGYHRTLGWTDLDEQSRLSWEMDADMVRGYLENAEGWRRP
jgi:hypothetical protein